jgi:hypothetical protein
LASFALALFFPSRHALSFSSLTYLREAGFRSCAYSFDTPARILTLTHLVINFNILDLPFPAIILIDLGNK